MHILYLTMNPNLGASARTLQDWLLFARESGIRATVCLRAQGPFSQWLAENAIPFRIVSMPWIGAKAAVSWIASAVNTAAWKPWCRPSVIHCYEHDLWPFAWPLAKALSIPAVCHFHFSVSRDLANWMFSSRWRKPGHAIWTSSQQRTDSTTAVEGLLPQSGQSVVPLGINLDRFGKRAGEGTALRRQLAFDADDVVVGCACALRERKRVDDFLDVVERLSSRYPNVRGLLAGGVIADEQAYGDRVVARIRQLESIGRLQWLGNVHDIEPILHASDIQVSTSGYETFGMSVCEAMACARPVAAYRGGSVAEVLGDAGMVVETGDLDGLTASVERLIVAPHLRQSLGRAARQRVAEHFNPRQSFEQLVGIYESLLKPQPARGRVGKPVLQST